MKKLIPLTELQAARIEATFHRRRALALETQALERDELAITRELELMHSLAPGSYLVDHVARSIEVK